MKSKKKGNAALLDANRFGVVSRLADDLAHEIKNPLHAIVINLEVLRRKVEKQDSAAALQRAEVVEQEVHRVHELVESLLRLLRPRRDVAGPFSIAEAVNGVLPLAALRARLAGVDFEQCAIPVEGYTDVAPDAMRFATLALTEAALSSAREAKVKIRIGCATLADAFELTIAPTSGPSERGAGADALKMARELLLPFDAHAQSNSDGSSTIHLPFARTLTQNSEPS